MYAGWLLLLVSSDVRTFFDCNEWAFVVSISNTVFAISITGVLPHALPIAFSQRPACQCLCRGLSFLSVCRVVEDWL
jgi:hypothetical protein